jgi:chromosome segregation ATPase
MFWSKKKLNSDEYEEVLKRIAKLRDDIEMLKLEIDPMEKKLDFYIKELKTVRKAAYKIEEEEKEEKEEKEEQKKSIKGIDGLFI